MSSDATGAPVVAFHEVSKAYRRYGAKYLVKLLGSKLLRRRGEVTAGRSNGMPFWALRAVSFEVGAGEALAIVGPNGAGKTTILKILSRITAPTEGDFKIKGRLASMIELGAGFHPELTGRENIYLNGSILGMRRSEIRTLFDDIVDFADIGTYLDTPVKRYSSGMFVRLGFAVAAHVDARVLLVDEVLAVGDVGFQRKCLRKLAALREGGAAVIFVSHNLHLVQGLATRALYLDHGVVRAEGEVAAVVARYVDAINLGTSEAAGRIQEGGTASEVKILDISLLGAENQRITRIASGDPVRVRISYRSMRDVPKARCGLSLWTGEGVRIATFDSAFAGGNLSLNSGDGFVDCVIPELALLPDRYFIRGGIYDGSTGWPIDRWGWEGGELSPLEVSTNTRYSREVVLTREHGILFIPASWES